MQRMMIVCWSTEQRLVAKRSDPQQCRRYFLHSHRRVRALNGHVASRVHLQVQTTSNSKEGIINAHVFISYGTPDLQCGVRIRNDFYFGFDFGSTICSRGYQFCCCHGVDKFFPVGWGSWSRVRPGFLMTRYIVFCFLRLNYRTSFTCFVYSLSDVTFVDVISKQV